MKTDGPLFVPSVTMKFGPPLNTVPVGAPPTLTTNPTFEPSPRYSVDVFVPLLATHHGEVGPAARPHALTRCLSLIGAAPDWSETSGVTV